MSAQGVQLQVSVGLEPDAEASELDAATAQLRHELLELDVNDVDRPTGGPPPAGARAAEVSELATLLVGLGPSAFGAVARAIAGWVGRGERRRVRLELNGDAIEVTGVSELDQARLIESFLARHAAAGDEPGS